MERAVRLERRQRRRVLRQVPRDHIRKRRLNKILERVTIVLDSLSDVQALLLENLVKDIKPRHDASRECPVCEVRGDWAKCVTKSGNTAKQPHKGRFTEEEMAAWNVV